MKVTITIETEPQGERLPEWYLREERRRRHQEKLDELGIPPEKNAFEGRHIWPFIGVKL